MDIINSDSSLRPRFTSIFKYVWGTENSATYISEITKSESRTDEKLDERCLTWTCVSCVQFEHTFSDSKKKIQLEQKIAAYSKAVRIHECIAKKKDRKWWKFSTKKLNDSNKDCKTRHRFGQIWAHKDRKKCFVFSLKAP